MTLLVLSVSVLGGWLLCGAILIGIGATVSRWLKLPAVSANSFWLGLVAAISVLETYHLFRRIDLGITCLLFLWGVVGLVRDRSTIVSEAYRFARQSASLLLLTAVSLILAIRAAGPCEHYDTGLYGAQTVRWFASYPAIPGLANLHGRLGFNSSLFPLVAALQQLFGTPLAYRLVEGLLLIVIASHIIPSCLRIFRGHAGSPRDCFFAVLAIPLTSWILRGDLVGTNTDLPATIVALFATYHLFLAFKPEDGNESKASPKVDSLVAIALVSLGVTLKLSMAVFAVLVWVLGLYRIWSVARGLDRPLVRHAYFAVFAILFLVLLPWACHGLILSGYPAYPSSAFGIPVDWKLPAESVHLVKAGVQVWARNPLDSLKATSGWQWQWLHPWFARVRTDREGFLFPVLISVAGLALVSAIRFARRQGRQSSRELMPLLPILGGLISWFYLAPALRFAEGFFWGLAAVLAAQGLCSLLASARPPTTVLPRFALVIIVCLSLLTIYPRTLWQRSFEPARRAQQYSPFPNADVVVRKAESGVEIYIPRIGDQCWDAPLPCAPYLDTSLRLRKAGDLRHGFTSEGLPPSAEWIGPKSTH